MKRAPLVFVLIQVVCLAAIIGLLVAIVSLDRSLSTSEQKSNATRVVTVTQRCALTALDAQFAGDARQVIGEFAPVAVEPFAVLRERYLVSLAGCEKQLAQVIKISHQTP